MKTKTIYAAIEVPDNYDIEAGTRSFSVTSRLYGSEVVVEHHCRILPEPQPVACSHTLIGRIDGHYCADCGAKITSNSAPTESRPQGDATMNPVEWFKPRNNWDNRIFYVIEWPLLGWLRENDSDGIEWTHSIEDAICFCDKRSADVIMRRLHLGYSAFVSEHVLCAGPIAIDNDMAATVTQQSVNTMPRILKGIGIKNGDGWKDTTEVGQTILAWDLEKPSPYSPGQYPRIGCPTLSASVDQFSFTPASKQDVDDYIEKARNLVGEMLVEINSLKATTAAHGVPDDLRAHGLSVAVHNDYRINGVAHTFWLFTDDVSGMSYKGEGRTDAEALNQIRELLNAAPSARQDGEL